jgi:hypothetical protein
VRFVRLILVPIVSTIALTLPGCNSQPTGEVVETVPAAGTLTYQGKPLEFYQVTFYPLDRRPAAGTTDENGHFVLGTNKPGDGAPPGLHHVTVTYVGPPNTDPAAGMSDFSPPPPPKVKIPAKYAVVKSSGLKVEIPEGGSQDLKIELE